MPGAVLLACKAAMQAGAGYVKLLADDPVQSAPAGLVVEAGALSGALADKRINAVLAGPGLGRDGSARARLEAAIAAQRPLVLDADALVLLQPDDVPPGVGVVATPPEGEWGAWCRA